MARRICRSRVTWMGVVLGAVALKLLLRRRIVWCTATLDEPECYVSTRIPHVLGHNTVPLHTGHFVVLP